LAKLIRLGKVFFSIKRPKKGGKAMKYGKETKKWVLRQMSCFFMCLFVFLFAGVFSQAQADERSEPVCGGTISENVTLTGNLDCSTVLCNTTLRVNAPARLDLNGFEVICCYKEENGASLNGDGIVVRGEGATILNGTVSGDPFLEDGTGIRLRDNGHHRVVNMRVLNCSSRGIRVDSDNNELTNNYIENSGKGIRVDGNNNQIVGNTMVDNDAENCDVRGSNNLFLNNIAKGGAEECFLVGDLDPDSDSTQPNDNLFQNNIAINCGAGGFVAASGTWDNSFIRNTAFENAPFDLIDYNNKNCKDNNWIMNTAKSGKPRCTTFPGIIQHSIFGK
jgi:parallel beta-helix repeat protein